MDNLTEHEKETIGLALRFLLSNSDDEDILEHLEYRAGTNESNHFEYIQNIIDKTLEQK